jgi:hypothetical protein
MLQIAEESPHRAWELDELPGTIVELAQATRAASESLVGMLSGLDELSKATRPLRHVAQKIAAAVKWISLSSARILVWDGWARQLISRSDP